MPDVIVTGLPRSGLTVVAALIDSLPNAVCLNAPAWQTAKARQIRGSLPYCKWLLGDFAWRRIQLLRREPIPDIRTTDASPLLDGIKDPRQPKTAVPLIRPGLTKDFILAMKHHAIYTAALPGLVEFDHFKIVAVIRHPLDVIHSWQRMDNKAIKEGKLPGASRLWPEAARISSSDTDPLGRMIQMYDAFCQRYWELRDKIDIIKFEDVVENPAMVSKLFGIETTPPAASFIEERPRILMRKSSDEILARLQKSTVFAKKFYEV